MRSGSIESVISRSDCRWRINGARGGKKLENAPEAILDEVLAKLGPIFE
jgi:hypothetical protein